VNGRSRTGDAAVPAADSITEALPGSAWRAGPAMGKPHECVSCGLSPCLPACLYCAVRPAPTAWPLRSPLPPARAAPLPWPRFLGWVGRPRCASPGPGTAPC